MTNPFRSRYVRHPTKRFVLPAAVLVVAAVCVFSVFFTTDFFRPATSPEMAELVAAARSTRWFEPRLTGGFAYRVLPAVTRSATDLRDSVPLDLRLASARIEKQSLTDHSLHTVGALGAAYLLTGQPDKSVAVLEMAARRAPDNDRLVSDLAA